MYVRWKDGQMERHMDIQLETKIVCHFCVAEYNKRKEVSKTDTFCYTTKIRGLVMEEYLVINLE